MPLLGQYVSPANQSPLDKISNIATPTIGASQSSVATSLAQKLLGAGASLGAIASTATTGLDNVSSQLRGDTVSLTQDAMTRVSPDDIINNRKGTKDNQEKFAESHMPTRKIADSRAKNSTAGTISYPPDLRKYYINFAFGEYKRPNAYLQKSAFSPNLHIALPMPTNLLDPSGVKLKPTELGGVLGAGLENISGVLQDIKAGGTLTKDKGLLSAIKSGANQGAGALYNTMFEAASLVPGLDDVAGTAGQLFGAVPNPHVTVFFQGVDLRSHSFTWRFAPKNVTESIIVQSIVKEFKKRMLPNYKWGEANVLGYPEMVQITLEPDMKEILYKFKPCMISSVNVNYAPNGIPSFFAGTKYPTSIEFQVNLQELEIFTSQDFGGQNGDAVKDIGAILTGDPTNGTARGLAEVLLDSTQTPL